MKLYHVTIEMNPADVLLDYLMSEHELIKMIMSAPGKAGEDARVLLHQEDSEAVLSFWSESGLSEGEWSLTWEPA